MPHGILLRRVARAQADPQPPGQSSLLLRAICTQCLFLQGHVGFLCHDRQVKGPLPHDKNQTPLAVPEIRDSVV